MTKSPQFFIFHFSFQTGGLTMWGLYWQYFVMGIIVLPGIIFAIWAQLRVVSSFNTFSKIDSSKGESAKAVARKLLDAEGLFDVPIEMTRGQLTDHYDPRNKTVYLSESVAHSSSLAAVAIAAHEVGHAFQDAKNYVPMKVRKVAVVACNISSTVLWPLVFIGLLFNMFLIGGVLGEVMMWAGVVFFGMAVVFNLITLPVEVNASRRALKVLVDGGHVDTNEIKGCKRVLSAAGLTYVAALLVSMLQLLRFVLFIMMARGRR